MNFVGLVVESEHEDAIVSFEDVDAEWFGLWCCVVDELLFFEITIFFSEIFALLKSKMTPSMTRGSSDEESDWIWGSELEVLFQDRFWNVSDSGDWEMHKHLY